MCIRGRVEPAAVRLRDRVGREPGGRGICEQAVRERPGADACLLYTSDAADERSSVDLGGRRIIKKKKQTCSSSMAEPS